MGDLTIQPCPKCELPLDPAVKSPQLHIDHCIGQSPYVLHNRKAGMVVYLSTEEWVALLNSNTGAELPQAVSNEVAARAVFGIAEYEPPTKD